MNCAALAAGCACLRARAAVDERRERGGCRAGAARRTSFAASASSRFPSETNFVLARVDVDDVVLGTGWPSEGSSSAPAPTTGSPGYVRVTVGPSGLMERFGVELRDVCSSLARPRRVTRVLCDPLLPARARSGPAAPARRRRRDVGAAVVGRRRRRPPLLRAGHRSATSRRCRALRVVATPSVGFDHVDVDGCDRARRVGVQRPRLLRRRDGRPRARAAARARARRRRARPQRARRALGPRGGRARCAGSPTCGWASIGFGRIGRALAARASRARHGGLRLTIRSLETTTSQRRALGPRRSTSCSRRSDAISVHAPLTPETRGLVGARRARVAAAKARSSSTPRGRARRLRRAARTRSRAATSAESRSTCSTSSLPPRTRRRRTRRGSSSTRTRAGTASRPRRLAVARAVESVLDVLEGRRAHEARSTSQVSADSVSRRWRDRPHILLVIVDQLAALVPASVRPRGHEDADASTGSRTRASCSRTRTRRARCARPRGPR